MMEREVWFPSEGARCAAIMTVPDGRPTGARRAAVVLCNGFAAVKEMVASEVARHLARAGYVALAFDYRFLGASDGEIRGQVQPWAQLEDVRNAITFLQQQPEVDPERIALWGTDLGAGVALEAAALDHRVRCTLAQSPVLGGRRWLREARSTHEWEYFSDRLDQDRTHRTSSGHSEYVSAVTDGGFGILPTDGPMAAWFEAACAANSTMRRQVTLRSAELISEWYPEPAIEEGHPRSVCVLVLEQDTVVSADQGLRAFERCLEPRRFVWLGEDVARHHVDLLSGQGLRAALEPALEFLRAYLPPFALAGSEAAATAEPLLESSQAQPVADEDSACVIVTDAENALEGQAEGAAVLDESAQDSVLAAVETEPIMASGAGEAVTVLEAEAASIDAPAIDALDSDPLLVADLGADMPAIEIEAAAEIVARSEPEAEAQPEAEIEAQVIVEESTLDAVAPAAKDQTDDEPALAPQQTEPSSAALDLPEATTADIVGNNEPETDALPSDVQAGEPEAVDAKAVDAPDGDPPIVADLAAAMPDVAVETENEVHDRSNASAAPSPADAADAMQASDSDANPAVTDAVSVSDPQLVTAAVASIGAEAIADSARSAEVAEREAIVAPSLFAYSADQPLFEVRSPTERATATGNRAAAQASADERMQSEAAPVAEAPLESDDAGMAWSETAASSSAAPEAAGPDGSESAEPIPPAAT